MIILQGCVEYKPDESEIDLSAEKIENGFEKELLSAAILAGDYLINASKSDGSFIYQYNASDDSESNNYNILRHAGTIYSMLQLYNITRDQHLLNISEKAIKYLLSFIKPFFNTSCLVYNDEVKLGGNALTIIALAEYCTITNDMTYLSTMKKLAEYIRISQNESGGFISKRIYSTKEISDFESFYYPGEAILSLVKLYELDNNESWLDIAEKAAYYLFEHHDVDVEYCENIPDHWLVIALNELYRFRTDFSYLDYCIKTGICIMNNQRDGINRLAEKPEWIGSFYTPPASSSTATLIEACIAVYNLIRDYDEKNDLDNKLFNTIKLGVEFLLKTQFTSQSVSELPNPRKAIGGFHETLTDYEIRVDYVQHGLCCLIGFYKILLEKNGK